MKKILGVFIIMVCTLLIVPDNVYAEVNHEEYWDEHIKLLAPDGTNAVLKMKKPTNMSEIDFGINGYVQNLLQTDGYYIYSSCNEDLQDCFVEITLDTENVEGLEDWGKTYDVKMTFDEPEKNSVVDSYLEELNKFDDMDPTTYNIVEDLSLINYYLTSNKSELWHAGAAGRALRYSTINNLTKGSNITYYIDIRAGNQDEELMFESAFGGLSLFYDGKLQATITSGVYLRRVIYIPENTENTKEAYVAAAQKRINEYLGNEEVEVTYGGLISSLTAAEDPEWDVESDGNYYNIKIGSRTYKFYIVKGTDTQLIEPTYVGLDIDSKIEITSKDSTIPLDTSIMVENVNDNSIKDIIGTDKYKTYDISLYSAAKDAKIEKLSNGKFLVKIPVPTEFTGSDLIVYYITSDGKVEEHEVVVKDGYAIFETNHFSKYSLAVKTNNTITNNEETNKETIEENPNTYDGIVTSILIGVISLIGCVGSIVYLKKRSNIKGC
ncbi:MAG: hypothetical protein ACI31M_02890 [Bacilli bacterium]